MNGPVLRAGTGASRAISTFGGGAASASRAISTFGGGAAGALLLVLAGQTHAFAQRAVQAPSASVAAPAAAPPGMEDAIVYGGDITSHLQAEVTSANSAPAKVTMFDDTDSNLYGNYGSWLSLYGNLHLERTRNDNADDYFPTSNTAFRSEGLTMRQLFAAVRPTSALTLYAGKIHPNFGSAYANVPGNFYTFASDYEQTERIGFGVEYRLPADFGLDNARITLEADYLDTTFLSTSLLSQPSVYDPTADRAWRYRRTMPMATDGNTGQFNNWALALQGGRPETGLTYQLSFEQQGTGQPGSKTESGGSLGLMYDPGGGDGIALGRRLGVVPFVEYAQFSNFNGNAGEKERYLTGGLAFHYVRWELDVSGGLRKGSNVLMADGSRADGFDRQESVSLNYTVIPYPQITVGVGINHINDTGDPIAVIAKGASWGGGPSLTYSAPF